MVLTTQEKTKSKILVYLLPEKNLIDMQPCCKTLSTQVPRYLIQYIATRSNYTFRSYGSAGASMCVVQLLDLLDSEMSVFVLSNPVFALSRTPSLEQKNLSYITAS